MIDNSDGSCTWHFDTHTATFGAASGYEVLDDFSGLWVDTTGIITHGPFTVQMDYSAVLVGSPIQWRTVSATGVTFTGGLLVSDQTGPVT